MDIMSNMDAARFTSANVNEFNKNENKGKNVNNKNKNVNKTPMVIRNLNNQ